MVLDRPRFHKTNDNYTLFNKVVNYHILLVDGKIERVLKCPVIKSFPYYPSGTNPRRVFQPSYGQSRRCE